MKRWIVPLASLSAVAATIALALFLVGLFDGDDVSDSGDAGPEAVALCAEDSPDCEDTLVTGDGNDDEADNLGGDTVAPGCEVGHVGVCADTPISDSDDGELIFEGDGPAIQPVCAPGFPDCVDTIVNGSNGDLDDDVPPSEPIAPVEGERDAVDAAVTDAETRFGVDGSAIVVESAAFQVWSNACLDAAEEGAACAAIVTPGFVIVLDVEGTQYEYHTDLNGNVRLAP